MKQIFKSILSKISPRLLFAMQVYRNIKSEDSYYIDTGHFRSHIEDKPVDKDSNPIPWMNYSVVRFLKERLDKNMSLLEFGSGYSTRFYAKKVKKVVSIEHNKEWFDMIKNDKPVNCDILYIAYDKKLMGKEYSQATKKIDEKFDIIVVDGRDRVNCIKNSINSLASKGVMILDDSSRERYKEAFDFMILQGFKNMTICGLKYRSAKEDCTTLFYRQENCLDI